MAGDEFKAEAMRLVDLLSDDDQICFLGRLTALIASRSQLDTPLECPEPSIRPPGQLG